MKIGIIGIGNIGGTLARKLSTNGHEVRVAKPGELFATLIPFFVFDIDHASYARLDERPFGKWDTWLNVINVEV